MAAYERRRASGKSRSTAVQVSEDEGDSKPEIVRGVDVTLMRKRSDEAFSFDTQQRQRVIEDMKFAFVSGHQWDGHLTKKRRNRPCYEFNRVRQLIRRVTGQQLKNKPAIKCRATESGDVDTAEVYNGLIRNIEVQSSAETAYDTAFQWSCGGGFGVLRVCAEYESENSFDQCLKIKTVHDPANSVWCDPAAKELDRSDARYWFITDTVPRSVYREKWPNADVVDFSTAVRDQVDKHWWYEDSVRIAEYWYFEPVTKKIHQLNNGAVVDADEFDPIAAQAAEKGLTIVRTREVETKKICSVLVSGAGPLEDPTEWGGSMFPIVPQWGDIVTINGEQIYSGMTRFARDAQTIHNFELSTIVEIVAKMPNSPLMATPKMIEGLKSYYERLGYDDPPVLLYNADPDAPQGRPQREPTATFPAAMANISGMVTEEMKAVTGIYDASLGNRSNETSGRAILARQNEGDIANFVYIDNQVKALKRIGEVLVDAIPHYYDAERSIRILGEDNAEKFVEINKVMMGPDGEPVMVNDLSRGKYDVTVTVGKAFDTARMEVAEAAQALVGTPGPFGLLAQYLLISNLDVPGIDEYRKAARKVLVGMSLLEPGEDDPPPPPPQPNPKDVADAKLKDAQAGKAQAQTQEILATLPGKAAESTMNAIVLGMPPEMAGAPPGGMVSPDAMPMNAGPVPADSGMPGGTAPNGGFPPPQ